MSRYDQVTALIWTACFSIGTFTHACDIWVGGWLPYNFMPLPFNIFWTALLPLDFITVLLLWVRRRVAVVLGVAIMIADVLVNSYTVFVAGYIAMQIPLLLQTLFLLFVLLTASRLWHSDTIQTP